MIDIEPDNQDDMYKDAMYNVGVAYQNWGVALKAESDKKVEASKGKVKEDLTYKEKFKSALSHFEKVVEFKKDDPTIYQALGRLYANLNMTKEAKAAFETADKLLKGN
jgi:Flp pilus assembly protein TadD